MAISIIFLASGLATRFGNLLEYGEKHILPLPDGTPALVSTINILYKILNVKNVYVITRPETRWLYLSILQKYVQDINLEVIANEKYTETNNSYTLYLGLKEVIKRNDDNDIIVMNADIVVFDLKKESAFSISIPNELSALVSSNGDPEYMRALIDNEGYVTYIGFDIPQTVKYVNFMGIYIPRSRLEDFYQHYESIGKKYKFICWFENVLNAMIAAGTLKLKAWYLFDKLYWDEIDNIEDLIRLHIKYLYRIMVMKAK